MSIPAIPDPPAENTDPWFDERDAFDAAVKEGLEFTREELEGRLSEDELSAKTVELVEDVTPGILAADPTITAAAAAAAGPAAEAAVDGIAGGMLNAGRSQAFDDNRVPNPLGIGVSVGTGGTNRGAGIHMQGQGVNIQVITTGLPEGFTSGLSIECLGTNSTGTPLILANGSTTSGEYSIPVTPGERVSISEYIYVEERSSSETHTGRVRAVFYDQAGAQLSYGDTTNGPITPNVWTFLKLENILVPAGAARAAVQVVTGLAPSSVPTGLKFRLTGWRLRSALTISQESYGDGARRLWNFEGEANKSPSVRVFRTDAENAAIDALIGSGVGGLTVQVAGTAVTVSQRVAGKVLETTLSLTGSQNNTMNINRVYLDGVQAQDAGDDITPIRTQMGTVGANHGYTCVSTFANPDGKTVADVGSVWTDGTREYVLLGILTGSRIRVGGSYAGGGATPVTSADVNPTTPLTHVSGATHTGQIDHTTISRGTGTHLAPGSTTHNKDVLYIDGETITADGTYHGQSFEIRESYQIVDYADLYDTAKATVGTAITALNVDGAVLVQNVWRWLPGGVLQVDHTLDELVPTTLGQCGGVQAKQLDTQGSATVTRYVPGMGVVSGFDWSAGVPLGSYATSVLLPASSMLGAQAPGFHLDVLANGATPLLGFACGYIPNRRTAESRGARRIEKAPTVLWDMRSTKKAYPTWTSAEPAGWQHVEIAAYRVHLAPSQVTAVLSDRTSAPAAYGALAAASGLPLN